MFSNPDALLARAIELFQRQQLEEAQRCLQQVLRVQPRNFDALHVMGVVLALRGQREQALEHFYKAARIQPNHPRLNFNYARLLAESGQDEKALPVHQRAVQAAPDYAPAWLNYGQSLMRLQRAAEARECFERALALQPDYPEALIALGRALADDGQAEAAMQRLDEAIRRAPQLGLAWYAKGCALARGQRHAEAVECFREATRLDPRDASAWFEFGATCLAIGDDAGALACFDAVLHLDATHPEAWMNKGVALSRMLRWPEAVDASRRALELLPDNVQALVNLGGALTSLRQNVEARPLLERALALDPQQARGWFHLGITFQDEGLDEEALSCYEKALALKPDFPELRHRRSIIRLGQLDFARAWPEYEWRLELKDSTTTGRDMKAPPWTGGADERLFVWLEQGVGDQILFGTMLPELQQRPGKTSVWIHPKLQPLMARSLPGLDFVPQDWVREPSRYDTQVPIGSLGRFLRPDAGAFGGTGGAYLRADPARVGQMRQSLSADPRPVCGISWWSRNEKIGAGKSMRPADLEPLLQVSGCRFASLQYSPTAADLDAFRALRPDFIENIGGVDYHDDVDGLAAVIEACDLVITISNTTAHLAGALGKPTLLLVPVHERLWYWTPVEGRSLWYRSVVVLTQDTYGQWSGPVAQARELLHKHLG